MKGRLIAGVLVIALGLSGCDTPESAEATVTTATTTAAFTTTQDVTTATIDNITTQSNTSIELQTDFVFNENNIYKVSELIANMSVDELKALKSAKLFIDWTDYNVDDFLVFGNLEYADIIFSNHFTVDKTDFQFLKSLMKLRYLSVNGGNDFVGEFDLINLKNCKNLEEIKIYGMSELINMDVLSDFENLQSLTISETTSSIFYDSTEAFYHMPNLKKLELHGGVIGKNYFSGDFISGLKSIEELILYNCNITGIPDLGELKNFSRLELTACVNIIDFEFLLNIPNLKYLKYSPELIPADIITEVKKCYPDCEFVISGETQMSFENAFQTNDEISLYDMLYPVYQDGSYDYIDKTGKVIIDGNFDTAEFFSEGLGIVSKDGKYGAVKCNGDIVVPLKYLYLSDFNSGLAYASIDGINAGFINGHNEVKIPFRYSYLDWVENPVETKFSEGFAIVLTKEEETYGHPIVIDTSGKELFSAPPISGYGTFVYSDFHSGVLYADYGYTNYMNERIYELPLDTIYDAPKAGVYPGVFSEGFAYVPTLKDKSLDYDEIREQGRDAWCYEYINTSGETAFNKQFYKAGKFSEGLAVVEKDGKTGVIDTSGEFVFYFDGLDPYWHKYSDGLLPFRKNDDLKYGFIDRNGEIALPAEYDDVVRAFNNGLALVEIDGKLAYINKQGEIIYDFEKAIT